MKKLFFSLFICLCTTSFAQEFSVKQFFLAETDLTANTPGTMVEDQNGNPCALIKVETTLDGYTFNVGVLGVKDTKRVGGEIWVYVPFGVKKITIGHPKLGTIRDYFFPCKIDKGRTYILKLNAKLGGRTYDTSKKQKMVLNIYPKSASVEINNTPIQLNNGKYSSDFSFGIYDITVSAPRYHTSRKQVEVNDLENDVNVNIYLKQKFGWLQIPGEGDEKLWINGEQRTFVSDKKIVLDSGHHLIRMTKPLHEPYETTIEIKDSIVNRITPNFIVRYREMEFNVAENAEIWINGRHFGNGYWKGRLEYGHYSIECKKSRHVSSVLDLKIESNTIEQVTLKAPEPIYGRLTVTSSPSGADIYIDGVKSGVTPQNRPLIIGTHVVEVKKTDFTSESRTITILENDTQVFNTTLVNTIGVKISSTPTGSIILDGKLNYGNPLHKDLTLGKHKLKIAAPSGYKDLKKTINVSETNIDFEYTLQEKKKLNEISEIFKRCNLIFGFTAGTNFASFVGGIHCDIYLLRLYSGTDILLGNGSFINMKLGYGIPMSNRLLLTPSIGYANESKTDPIEPASYSDEFTQEWKGVSANCKLTYAIFKRLAVYIEPQFLYFNKYGYYYENENNSGTENDSATEYINETQEQSPNEIRTQSTEVWENRSKLNFRVNIGLSLNLYFKNR